MLFASRRRSERRNQREVYLTISAAVDDYRTGTCPALNDGRCSIYDRQPITCRTAPLHYSRQPSTLQSYLDRFVATRGYQCETADGPIVLKGSAIVSPELRASRDRAADLAKGDRGWKSHIVSFMDDPVRARSVELPTYDAVLANTESGYATLLPMIVAWRISALCGLLSRDQFKHLCTQQLALIRIEVARSAKIGGLQDLIPLYELGATGRDRVLEHAARSCHEASPMCGNHA